MLTFFICGLLFLIKTHVDCKSDYDYYPKAEGWLKLNKVSATWQQAFLQCHNEGAVLASPLNEELRQEMQSIIEDNNNLLSYFIGSHSQYTAGQFVSIEGVPLTDMPTTDMYQMLDSEQGQCLSTNGCEISVVSCFNSLPYLCYKKDDGKTLTKCGTFDREYQYKTETGSCYKVHREYRTASEANSVCIAEGGYLAVVNDPDEARIITKMNPVKCTEVNNLGYMFIGLRDWTGNGTWLSGHGEAIDRVYHIWHSDEPRFGHCVGLDRCGTLGDLHCEDPNVFVCEKDPQNIRYSNKE